MFGALSPTAVGDTSLAFVSAAAHGRGVREAYGLNKQTAPVRGTRTVAKKDMVLNDATPTITVDPESFTVVADGEGSGVRVARVREASLRSLRGGGAAAVAEGVLAVVKSMAGQEKRAKFQTSKAPLSAVCHSFWLIFGRAIISRNGLEA